MRQYSPEITARLRSKAIRFAIFWGFWFLIIGGVSVYLLNGILHGRGDAIITGLLITVLIFSLLPAFGSFSSLFLHEPELLSYFSEKVPGCGLTKGHRLLRNSKDIDRIARNTCHPGISAFISDDDFFDRKEVTWRSAAEMLALTDLLLAADDEPCILDMRPDLENLRPRLAYADENGIKFCFLVRTATGTNGIEWEQRKGYY